MTIHHFPCRTNGLGALLVRASIWPSEWKSVLRALDDSFPGAASALRVSRLTAPAPPLRSHSNWNGQGAALSCAWPTDQLADLLPGTVFRLSDPADPQMDARSKALDDGQASGLGLVLHRTPSHVWTLRVHSPRDRTSQFDAGLTVLLQRFAEPLRHCFLISHGLGGRGQPGADLMRRFWDQAAFGIALVTPSLRPVVTNAAAEDLIGTRRFFFPPGRNGRLRLASHAADERLHEAAADIAAGRADSESIELGKPWERHRLTIRLDAIGRNLESSFLPGEAALPSDRLIATLQASSHLLSWIDRSEQAANGENRHACAS